MINPVAGSAASDATPAEDVDSADASAADGDARPSVTGLVYNGGAHSSVATPHRFTFGGEVADAEINGDDGSQAVDVFGGFSGTINGGGGADDFFAHGGSTVSDAEINGHDGDDVIEQRVGATFRNVDVHGGDDADRLNFAGANENVTIDPGDNEERPDVIALNDTVTGDLSARDGGSWWVKPKDESEGDLDMIRLIGDGWSESDGGYALRSADGETLAELGIEGDADHFENIASYDSKTGGVIEQFQKIDPEVKYDNMWAKWTGTALQVVGGLAIATGVGAPIGAVLIPVGQGFKSAHDLDNNLKSWGGAALDMGLSIGTGVAAGYAANASAAAEAHGASSAVAQSAQSAANTATTVNATLNGAVNFGRSAAAGDEAGAFLGLSGLMTPVADVSGFREIRNLSAGAGHTWRAVDAVDQGAYGSAAIGGLNAGTDLGVIDTDSSAYNVAGLGVNGYNAVDGFASGDPLRLGGAIASAGMLPNGLGWDDSYDVRALTGFAGTAADIVNHASAGTPDAAFPDLIGRAAEQTVRNAQMLDYQAPVQAPVPQLIPFPAPRQRQQYPPQTEYAEVNVGPATLPTSPQAGEDPPPRQTASPTIAEFEPGQIAEFEPGQLETEVIGDEAEFDFTTG